MEKKLLPIKRAQKAEISQKIRLYSQQCANRLWLEETAFLNDLLGDLDEPASPQKECRDEVATLEKTLANLENELKRNLQELDSKLKLSMKKLDQDKEFLKKFSRPSKDLERMRKTAQKLLKGNRIEETQELIRRIKIKTKDEEKNATLLTRQSYHDENIRIMRKYAQKRYYIQQKYSIQVSLLNSDFENHQKIILARIEDIKSNARLYAKSVGK